MSAQSLSAGRSIALVRILTGIMFLCEGYAKLAGKFLHGGFAADAAEMATRGFPFWRPFLEKTVVPHASLFSWAVALGETALGLSLVTGLLVRWASAGGILLLVSIGLGTSWPGAGTPWPRFVTAWLTQFAYIGLLLIFSAADAGRVFGLDARRK